MDPDATVRLLTAILTDQPRLVGAACIGRHELFDPICGNRAPAIPAPGTTPPDEGGTALRRVPRPDAVCERAHRSSDGSD